jgi:type I restriction enzyme R subunit
LHSVVDKAIEVKPDTVSDEQQPYDISKIDFERLRQEFERSRRKNTTVQNLKLVIECRLNRLLEQNPLRTDFQRHYEKIVADYNREKDQVTIETTFEALLRFNNELDDEERRAMREGLDEETLAIFDLLKKQDLSPSDIKRLKDVAGGLLERLKAEKLRVDHWRDKESTRDAVRIAIRDFLWSDETGLPINVYSDDEVEVKTEDVFRHIFRAYPTLPSPFYATA